MEGPRKRGRTAPRKVSWLNLHLFGFPRDIRTMIYKMMSPADLIRVKLAHNRSLKLSKEMQICVVEDAAEFGSVELLVWLQEELRIVRKNGDYVFYGAASAGQVHVLIWADEKMKMFRQLSQNFIDEAQKNAVSNGHLNVLEWIKTHNMWRKDLNEIKLRGIAVQASEYGQQKVVEWTGYHDRFDVPHSEMLEAAAKGGHLDLIKWFHQNSGFHFLIRFLYTGAVKGGHIHIIEWGRSVDNDEVWNVLLQHAIAKQHIRFAAGYIFVFVDMAIRARQFNMLKWLHLNGYYIDQTCCELAVAHRQNEPIVQWMLDSGFVPDQYMSRVIKYLRNK